MTFRRTPYTPYDTTGWTASPEPKPEISYEAAKARRPADGVPLRKPYSDNVHQEWTEAQESYYEALGIDDFDAASDR